MEKIPSKLKALSFEEKKEIILKEKMVGLDSDTEKINQLIRKIIEKRGDKTTKTVFEILSGFFTDFNELISKTEGKEQSIEQVNKSFIEFGNLSRLISDEYQNKYINRKVYYALSRHLIKIIGVYIKKYELSLKKIENSEYGENNMEGLIEEIEEIV